MNRCIALTIPLLGSLLFAGCALGPDLARPVVAAPTTWKEAAPPAAPALPQAWWEIFGDPELDAIARQVLAANHDVQLAAARVAEARAVARLGKADLYPSLSSGAGYTRERRSENQAGIPGAPLEASDYRNGFDLAYEFDFWGRIRRGHEAARADAEAVEDDFHFVQLALTAEAARHYHQLRTFDAERQVLDVTLALRRDTLRLQESRHEAGLINEVDVTRARTELATVETELLAVRRQRARVEHALAILCGQPPSGFAVASRAASETMPEIPVGLPATVLQRRPDLAAFEHRLDAAAARVGVAKADFFPRFSLTGSAGLASAELGSWLESGSRAWSFGPSVYIPVFDGGRNRAQLAAAQARYEQAVAGYRGAALAAFREVEDALSDLAGFAAENDAAQRALRSARDTASLAATRYERGLTGYLDVVDAQRAALQAERLAHHLQGQRLIATVFLAKALGGGWSREAVALGQ